MTVRWRIRVRVYGSGRETYQPVCCHPFDADGPEYATLQEARLYIQGRLDNEVVSEGYIDP